MQKISRKYIIIIFVIGLGLNACQNANEKQIGEIEGLISIIDDTQKTLLSVDTSQVFSAKRQMENDLKDFNSTRDTLTKAEAFVMDNYYSSKKRIYRLTSNYAKYMQQINFSRKQLEDLKQDLENGLISKKNFSKYYTTEQMAVMDVNSQITEAISGLDVALGKLILDRPDVLKIIEQKKLKADRKSTRLNSSHTDISRMPSSA